jgi:hypothetical protein
MRPFAALVLLAVVFSSRGAFCEEQAVELWMPDGQLRSNPVRVYVTHTVTPAMKPTLRLLTSHVLLGEASQTSAKFEPWLAVPNQTWVQPTAAGDVSRSGSTLIFDLNGYPIPKYKAMVRLIPMLTWAEGGIEHTVVGPRPVNLGNGPSAWMWSLGVACLAIAGIGAALRGRIVRVVLGEDGHLSLSRLQVAVWTIAVGLIVFGHGLIQLDLPTIPTSIVALMGLSIATGTISYLQGGGGDGQPGAAVPDGQPASHQWSFADLVVDKERPGQESASISRAQMLFWTILMVLLFLVKSLANGVVWEVPWEMVALMGISQAGYLTPRLVATK